MNGSSQYGTSSIEWRRPEPKVVELYNTEQVAPVPVPGVPYGATPLPDPAEQQRQALVEQRAKELETMRQMMRAQAEQGRFELPGYRGPGGPQAEQRPSPQEKRAHRRQLRDFFSEVEDPQSDPLQGIQSLIDSGAIVYDENGLWIAQPNIGEKKGQQLLAMADAWADQTGLWEGGQFRPENYRPYGAAQNRMQWETRQTAPEGLSPDAMRALLAAGRE
jgi:hypothetical protein